MQIYVSRTCWALRSGFVSLRLVWLVAVICLVSGLLCLQWFCLGVDLVWFKAALCCGCRWWFWCGVVSCCDLQLWGAWQLCFGCVLWWVWVLI